MSKWHSLQCESCETNSKPLMQREPDGLILCVRDMHVAVLLERKADADSAKIEEPPVAADGSHAPGN